MRLSFCGHVLDTDRRQLLVSGRPATISTKAFDLLSMLADARPAVLGKEALIAALWPDAHVSDNSLAVLVAELRGALRETARAAVTIRTVHRVGYAFSAPAVATPTAGAARFVLVGGDRPWPLGDGECVVGRDPLSDYVVAAPSISRRHARLVISPRGVEVHDLDSKNGTFVEQRRVVAPTMARDGAVLRFGSVPFTIREVGAADETATAPTRPPV